MHIKEKLQKDVILAPFTTYGIGGPADYFLEAKTLDDLVNGIFYAREHTIPYFILGKGANILVGDKGFRGLVIRNQAPLITLDKTEVTAESGVDMADLIAFTIQHELSGFEHFAGIPSTVGGAMWQNLHFLAPNRKDTVFIGDVVKHAQILTEEGEIKEVGKEYFKFDYDTSILHSKKDVVLRVTFALTPCEKKILEERRDANLTWRGDKHPKDAHKMSAGSVFKKIESFGAGRLLEAAGLKGHRIGGAEVSRHHANFIVNVDHATAKNIRDLILLGQTKVREQSGLELQPEISFIGEF